MINSSYAGLHTEIEKLKKIFGKNGYPIRFIDKCISNFFNKMYQERETVHTVPKKEVSIILPFLGSISWKVKKELVNTISDCAGLCNIKVVFKSSNKLSSFFSFKDKLPKSLMSGVIYQFHCARCNLSYVGSTKRYWEKRLEEHLHISALTGKPLAGQAMFAPMQHVRRTCSHESPTMGRKDFRIIGRESNPFLLLLKESIFINKLNPEINGTETSVPLYLFKQ